MLFYGSSSSRDVLRPETSVATFVQPRQASQTRLSKRDGVRSKTQISAQHSRGALSARNKEVDLEYIPGGKSCSILNCKNDPFQTSDKCQSHLVEGLRQRLKLFLEQRFSLKVSTTGSCLTSDHLKPVFKEIDQNHDSIITFQEFAKFLHRNDFAFQDQELKLFFQIFGLKEGFSICANFIPGIDFETFCLIFWKVRVVDNDDTDDLIIANAVPQYPQYGSAVNPKSIHFKTQHTSVRNLDHKGTKMFDFSQNDLIKKEWLLKSMLSTIFSTTKNAYLALKQGSKHYSDNYITLTDIQSFVNRTEKDAVLSDEHFLKQLFQHRGILKDDKIEFEPFKKWIGSAMEGKEHCIFRHSTRFNPHFQKQTFEEGFKSPRKAFAAHPLGRSTSTKEIKGARKLNLQTSQHSNLFQDFLDKIKTKYCTLAKAYSELNYFKDEQGISLRSLGKMLLSFGYFIDHEALRSLFEQFDTNGDGFIDQEECFKMLGDMMLPGTEHFQKIEKPEYQSQKCKDTICLNRVQDSELFCHLHQQKAHEQAIRYFKKIRHRFSTDEEWGSILEQLQNSILSFPNVKKILGAQDPLLKDLEAQYVLQCLTSSEEDKQTLLKDLGNLKLEDGVIQLTKKRDSFSRRQEDLLKAISETARAYSRDTIGTPSGGSRRQKETLLSNIMRKKSFSQVSGQAPNSEALAQLINYFQAHQDEFQTFRKIIRKNDVDKTGFAVFEDFVELLGKKVPEFDDQVFKENLLKFFQENGFVSLTNAELFNYQRLFNEFLPINTPIEQIMAINQSLLKMQSGSKRRNIAGGLKAATLHTYREHEGAGMFSSTLASSKPALNGETTTILSPAGSKNEGFRTTRNNYLAGTSSASILSMQLRTIDPQLLKVREKLQYEWKSIFKLCQSYDKQREGIVKLSTFEKVLNDLKVYALRDELKKLSLKTTGGALDTHINYRLISDVLHLPRVFEGEETEKYLDKVNQMKLKLQYSQGLPINNSTSAAQLHYQEGF